MFSPGTKRANLSRRKERNEVDPHTPVTPLAVSRKSQNDITSIPNRPTTGTPAPWAPRLSVLARIPPAGKSDKGDEIDPIKPVFVGEFPQVLRDEQTNIFWKHVSGDALILGGIDQETCLSWIICEQRLFIWNYLSSAALNKCVILEIPSNVFEYGDNGRNSCHGSSWLLSVVSWDSALRLTNKAVHHSNNAGIILCNRKTRAVVYWPNISESVNTLVTSVASSEESEVPSSPADGKFMPKGQRHDNRFKSGLMGSSSFNSLIASAVPDMQQCCVALACSSNGELWQFYCSPTGVQRSKVYHDLVGVSQQSGDSGQAAGSKGYPRSLTWSYPLSSRKEPNQQFFLLTDHELQCFNAKLCPDFNVVKLWSHEIVGTDGDLGIKKDLAGQKRIWPLDVQVDNHCKVNTILVATFCKDCVSSSSYTEYSILTMQYKSGINIYSDNCDMRKRFLSK